VCRGSAAAVEECAVVGFEVLGPLVGVFGRQQAAVGVEAFDRIELDVGDDWRDQISRRAEERALGTSLSRTLHEIEKVDVVDVIGEILVVSVGLALSPFPIAAVILMLLARRARVTAPLFLVGWSIGLALVATVVVLIPGLSSDSGEPSTTTGVIKGVLGVLLLSFGVRQWVSRPGPDDEVAMPKWMAAIDTMGARDAFGLGFLLSALNPMNILLAAAAGASIGAADLSVGQNVATIAVFTSIASLTVVVPVIGYFLAGDRLQPALDNAEHWVVDYNTAILSVLFLVFGALLIGDAIAII
jgi:threonine/homoserine/homoserine lactone efflux protein